MGYSNWSNTNDFTTKASYGISSEEAKLVASDKAANDYFGNSVSINADGTKVVIGARYANPDGISYAGAVYIFKYNGSAWSQEAKLVASDKADTDYFGVSVSINADGTKVVIGAYYADPDGISGAGAAYIFKYNGSTWSQEAKLVASDKAVNDIFGYSVSINADGTKVVIGAYGATPDGTISAGAAYIFKYNGSAWSQEAKLAASDKVSGDRFGYSVSINADGTKVVICAYIADPGGIINAGAVYIFKYNGSTWSQEAKLVASDKAANDYFGVSVSINADGTKVVIGAHLADPDGISAAGAAYIFKYNGSAWSQEAKLVASDKEATDYFGYSVSINADGTKVVIGAYNDDSDGIGNAGAAYIFKYNGSGWIQEAKLVASDKAAGDIFGYSVSINADGAKVVISAYQADPGGTISAGAAYIFK
jgi:hypothetical protein